MQPETQDAKSGDGFLDTFDGPARAVRCADAIGEAVRPLGIEVRAGLHTGEVEVIDAHRPPAAIPPAGGRLADARARDLSPAWPQLVDRAGLSAHRTPRCPPTCNTTRPVRTHQRRQHAEEPDILRVAGGVAPCREEECEGRRQE